MKKNRIYFISGHRDITKEEFDLLYIPKIMEVIMKYNNVKFIMGDYEGVDIMAQNFLLDILNFDPNDIAVYHMGKIPMNVNKKVKILVPNFTNDIHRDSTMTKESDYDIAFVREGKYNSGTAQNIIRRATFTNDNKHHIYTNETPFELNYMYNKKPCFLCKHYDKICTKKNEAIEKDMDNTCEHWKLKQFIKNSHF